MHMQQNKTIGLALACIAGIMPMNALRVFLYRLLFGYEIHKSRIGWNTILCVASAKLHNCSIGRSNRFIGPMRVVVKEKSVIGQGNTFDCGWWTLEERFASAHYAKRINIGSGVTITNGHHFDIVGAIDIGNATWIAGLGSQFWTHGVGVRDRDIRIGDNCYIGSAVRMAPGSSVGNNAIVALGSVVVHKFAEENVLLGGQPAKVLREDHDWRATLGATPV